MAFVMWIGALWCMAAMAVMLVFAGAKRSLRIRNWLFGPIASASVHQIAAAQPARATEPPVMRAA